MMDGAAVVIHLLSSDLHIGEAIPTRIVDLNDDYVHFTSDNPMNVGQEFTVLFGKGGPALAWSLYRVVACRVTATNEYITRARF
jgi:hypothetical protein